MLTIPIPKPSIQPTRTKHETLYWFHYQNLPYVCDLKCHSNIQHYASRLAKAESPYVNPDNPFDPIHKMTRRERYEHAKKCLDELQAKQSILKKRRSR